MSRPCRVILYPFVDEFIILFSRPSRHYRVKLACVTEPYANTDFLWLMSKHLQIIIVDFCSLSLHPVAKMWVNIQCACMCPFLLTQSTMYKTLLILGQKGEARGQIKAESRRNNKIEHVPLDLFLLSSSVGHHWSFKVCVCTTFNYSLKAIQIGSYMSLFV